MTMHTPAVGVPADLSAIDAGWVERALRHHGLDVAVEGVEVQPIAIGEGFIGLLARLTPSYGRTCAGAPASLVVKIPSPDPGAQLLGQMLRLWERERSFYLEMAPTIGVAVPRCYLAEEDPADQRVALLLEDLGHLDAPDQLEGTTRARAEAAIDWLIGFHAVGWGRAEDPTYLPWAARPDDAMFLGLQPLAAGNLEAFASMFAQYVTPQRLDVVRRAIDAIPEMLAQRDMPFTIAHGDFRLDNMLFRPDGELVMLDWQLVVVTSYQYDLTYFLTMSLTIEQRRDWERDLLLRYLEGIRARVDTDLTIDAVLDGHRRMIRFLCALMATTTVSIDFDVNSRARALANALVERVLVAADEHDVANLV